MVKTGFNYVLHKYHLPLEVLQVLNNFQQYTYPFDFSFFLTVALLTLLVCLVLLASCSSQFSAHPTFAAFSLSRSIGTLTRQSTGNRLNVLNGVKVLAFGWMLLFGSEYALTIYFVENTLSVEQNVLSTWKALFMESATLPADIFFFVGGFLAAVKVLPLLAVGKLPLAVVGKLHLLAVGKRALRVWPSLLAALLIYKCLLMHLCWGPYAKMNAKMVGNCSDLWRPLLFVDNLVQNGANMCMGWSWYLQVDLQLFAFSMLLLAAYRRSRLAAFVGIYLCIAMSFAYVFQQVYDHAYKYPTHIADLDGSVQYLRDIYYKPWGRCPTYLYGLLMGILYHEHSLGQPNVLGQLSRLLDARPGIRRLGEASGVLLGLFVILIPRSSQGSDNEWSRLSHAFYLTYGKFVFVVATSLVVMPAILCQKTSPLVGFLLDTKAFNLMSKLVFWAYLLHLTLTFQFLFTRNSDLYFTVWPAYPIFLSLTVSSLFFGLLMHLLV